MADSTEPRIDGDALTEVIDLRGGPPADPPVAAKKTRDWRPLYLIAPTMVILAIVIAYPVVKAVLLSFQRNPGVDPDTGRFVKGGFAGLDNYLLWLTGNCGGGRGTSRPAPSAPTSGPRSG